MLCCGSGGSESLNTIAIAFLLALSFSPCHVVKGRASQYAKGVFPRTIALRQGWGELPEDLSMYDGFIAVRESADIGRSYYIRPIGAKEWDYVLAGDCASKSDRQSETDARSGHAWMISEGIIAEIDYKTAVRWNTVGRMIDVEMKCCDAQTVRPPLVSRPSVIQCCGRRPNNKPLHAGHVME